MGITAGTPCCGGPSLGSLLLPLYGASSFCRCVGLRAGLVCLRSGNRDIRGEGQTLKEMQTIPCGPIEDSPSIITERQISCDRGQDPSYMCIAVRSSAGHRCVLLCLSME